VSSMQTSSMTFGFFSHFQELTCEKGGGRGDRARSLRLIGLAIVSRRYSSLVSKRVPSVFGRRLFPLTQIEIAGYSPIISTTWKDRA
jgi:hypothetical protein